MGTQPKPAPRAIFGPFEFDRSSGELWKHQTKLRLTGQPLQILEVLLDRPEHVVGREELQQLLWSNTTFVDFEHGLNAAINKLRQILGDSADQPRYIETMPGRRGYRFIAPVSQTSPRPALEIMEARPSDPTDESASEEALPPSHWLSGRAWLWRAAAAVGLVLVGAILAVAFWLTQPPPRPATIAQTMRFRIAIPEGMRLSSSQGFSLSPDARTLVYHASAAGGPMLLWAQPLDSLEPRALAAPRNGGDAPAFWSPDSKFVAYSSEEKLMKVDLLGNPAQVIAPVPGILLGGSWNRDGTIIFGTETGAIMRVEATGGKPVPVTVRDPARRERVHLFPAFLPDGRHFLYSRQSSVIENTGAFIGSLDVKPEDQSLTRLVATHFQPRFVVSPNGNGVILFQRETTLWAQNFDLSHLRLKGEPRVVAERVGAFRALGFFAASSGALVHRNALAEVAQLTWFDRRGQRLAALGHPLDLFAASPQISPDGTKVALPRFVGGNVDVWVHDLTRDVFQRITFDPAIERVPIWSPDGKRIVFSSARAGHYDLYQIRANGEGREELLYASNETKFATSWSADGRFLLYTTETGRASRGQSIRVLPLEGNAKHVPVALLNSQAEERSAVFSPDSRWIAYVSNESGNDEVYMQPFSFPPATSAGGPKLLLSRGGGTMPHWRADGKEILYHAADGTVMSVAVTTASLLRVGVPQRLFPLAGMPWDATGDGSRFLVGVPIEQGVPPFTVVLNWQTESRK